MQRVRSFASGSRCCTSGTGGINTRSRSDVRNRHGSCTYAGPAGCSLWAGHSDGAGRTAHAGLAGDSVTATLNSPNGLLSDATPISLSDTVTVSGTVEISAGNGTNIGSFMLTGVSGGNTIPEFIDFQDASIQLRVMAGDSAGGVPVTGYASGAKYIFSGLDFAGGTITGVNVVGSSADISNFGSLSSWGTLDNAHQISFAIDAIQFVDKPGADFADITINLNT